MIKTKFESCTQKAISLHWAQYSLLKKEKHPTITASIASPLKPNGNYTPPALTISNFSFCIYEFCMIFAVNSDNFLKQR
jgi:hypothetical protein